MMRLLVILLITPVFASVDHHESKHVDALAWMSGSWAGPLGDGTILEENWAEPEGGTIAALVRMTADGRNTMVELIVIEEQGDTLMLYVQQWDPGYKARTSTAQKMKLRKISSNLVSFETTGAGGLKTLTYERPDDKQFDISIETAQGDSFKVHLVAQ